MLYLNEHFHLLLNADEKNPRNIKKTAEPHVKWRVTSIEDRAKGNRLKDVGSRSYGKANKNYMRARYRWFGQGNGVRTEPVPWGETATMTEGIWIKFNDDAEAEVATRAYLLMCEATTYRPVGKPTAMQCRLLTKGTSLQFIYAQQLLSTNRSASLLPRPLLR